jgi:alkylated DNA repair dioxygenase AlkB
VNEACTAWNHLARRDGELRYAEDFLAAEEADAYLERLLVELDWREESLAIAGRALKAPRLVCWYGDPGARYRYSGTDHEPLPWTEALGRLRRRVEEGCARRFNSVLGNLYRDGGDSLGWHADKEKELGPEPWIASLSLGAERRFDLRHNQSRETLSLSLKHGSLLLMGGALQHHWRHRVPKQPGAGGPRINLSFRAILPGPSRSD